MGEETLVQLGLFTPDRIGLGEAWDALAGVEVERAARLFDALVARYPESAEAADGARIAGYWCAEIAKYRGVTAPERVHRLWLELADCPETLVTARLRDGLLGKLWDELAAAEVTFVPPDLPAGRLALALGWSAKAVESLTRALSEHPDEPVILIWLARAEWAAGHTPAARSVWARLLLVAPEAVGEGDVEDAEIASVIRQHGTEWAALHGWLQGVLPLLADLPARGQEARGRRAYECLLAAESARRAADHAGMVALRRALQQAAPAVLEAYLDRVERG